jgi:hypothetical protein
LGDKINVEGTITAEPATEGCVRVFAMEAKASIFGVGKVFEGFIERQAREAQDATAAWFRNALGRATS